MWDFFETVRHRHSVRRYQPEREVDRQRLHAILEAACSAPSAGDLQSYRIFIATQDELREKLARASQGQDFIADAPIILTFCADEARARTRYGERGAGLYATQDATIAASYAQLAVVAAGLGSTWVGLFDERAVAEAVGAGPSERPVALLSIGYPAEQPAASARRPLSEIVHYLV